MGLYGSLSSALRYHRGISGTRPEPVFTGDKGRWGRIE
jgi:hypothetical protein